MPSGGDYTRNRRIYENVSGSQIMAVGTGDTTLVTGKTNRTIYVQRIFGTITTDAAQSWSFEDSAGTPRVIAELPTSPGKGAFEFDFGPDGVPLTDATNFNLNVSAAGLAGVITWEAYMKFTAAFAK